MAPRWRRQTPLEAKKVQQPQRSGPPTQSDGSQYSIPAIAYDLETTGPNPKHCEVVQFGAVCANCGPAVPTISWAQARGGGTADGAGAKQPPHFVSLVMPKGQISQESYSIHGYHINALIALKATPFHKMWSQFVDFIFEEFGRERPLVFCAHSGTYFDHVILRREVQLAGLTIPKHWMFVDTLPIARQVFFGRSGKGSFTLGRLYSDLRGEDLEGAHDALVDATALAHVWAWVEAGVEVDPLQLREHPERQHVLFQQRLQEYVYGKDFSKAASRVAQETCRSGDGRKLEAGRRILEEDTNSSTPEEPLYRTTNVLSGRPWTVRAGSEMCWSEMRAKSQRTRTSLKTVTWEAVIG